MAKRRFVARVLCSSTHILLVALALASIVVQPSSLYAQAAQQGVVAGRNVNMVSGTTWPGGDKFLQRQNEPSVAVSTRNPLHMVAGANDYRSVDFSLLLDDDETGDAWLGVFKSFDGGQRWASTLLPGYRALHETTSPLYGYSAGADPVVRAGAHGLFFYSGLVFDRGTATTTGKSAIFVSRFIDNNNLEAGDPIAHIGTSIVASDSGATGRFLDKPWMAVDIPRTSSTCRIPATTTIPEQTVSAGAMYIAYTAITHTASGLRAEILLSSSSNCGVTWNAPVRVSRPQDLVNQGATIAINPMNGDVYVAWRRLAAPGSTDSDAYLVAKSTNQGRKFSNPGVARRFPRGRKVGLSLDRYFEHQRMGEAKEVEALDVAEFDQGTSASALSFRTNAYPTMTFDGDGRLYLAWSERGYGMAHPGTTDGDARIVMTTTMNGTVFTVPRPVDETGQPGHQIMPTLTFANGRLLLVYYDLREDVSGVFSPYIDDWSAISAANRRHSIDLRATTAAPAHEPEFASSTQVSHYMWGTKAGELGLPRQLQLNVPNLPLFKQGTVPFIGDYIDVAAAPSMVQGADGRWQFNTAAGTAPVFHGVWTDNRDVKPPASGDWSKYTKPGVPADVCDAGTRNQNIYTARLTTGLIAGSPGNTKPLNMTFPRAFVVYAQNTTEQVKSFRFTIVNQPAGGRASFLEYPVPPYAADAPPPVTQLDIKVPRRSLVARTVYATSTDPHARINVEVAEIAGEGAPAPVPDGLRAAVVLNPDIENPDIENPDIENPDIENTEVHNPDIENAVISNPDIENPDIENPDIENPDIENPDIENPDLSNPDIENPDIENPDIENPDIENPDIENPDIENGTITDVTWTVTNKGNTTTAFDVKLFFSTLTAVPTDVKLQLILYRIYKTPLANGCALKEQTHNVLVASILDPRIENPDIENAAPQAAVAPDADTPTLWIEPGGVAKITLRIYDKDRTDGNRLEPTEITPEIKAQPKNTEDLDQPDVEPPSASPAPAPDVPLLAFDVQPVSAPFGQTLPEFVVSVKQNGASVQGVAVSIAFADNPVGAELSGTRIVETNADGLAAFTNLQVTKAGTGFRFAASAASTNAVPVLSAAFDSQSAPTLAPGDILVADGGPSTVKRLVKIAADGSGGGVFAEMPEPSSRPIDIARDPNGDYIIVDPVTQSLLKLSAATGVVTSIYNAADTPPLVGFHPVAVTVDANGVIYVGDNSVDRVYRFTKNGATWDINSLALAGPSPGLAQNIDLAIESPGVVIAAYEGVGEAGPDSSEIDRLDFLTSTVTRVVWPGSISPRPDRISGLAIEASGQFVVADMYNGNAAETSLWRVASNGTSAQLVATGVGGVPTDVEIDATGRYIVSVNGVSDPAGPRVLSVDPGTGVVTLITSAPLTLFNPNAVAIVPTPLSGGALQFDGIDDFAQVSHTASLNLYSMTLEAWVKIDGYSPELPTDTPHAAILEKGADYGNYTLDVILQGAGGNVGHVHQNTTGGNFSCCSIYPDGPVRQGIWTHVAATFDAATGRSAVFVNGSEVTSLTGTYNTPLTNGALLYLGREIITSHTEHYLNGVLDEVRVWNVARSPAQILASYNKVVEAGTPGLVGYWRFNEGTGVAISDSSGLGNNGTLGPGTAAPARVASTAPIVR